MSVASAPWDVDGLALNLPQMAVVGHSYYYHTRKVHDFWRSGSCTV